MDILLNPSGDVYVSPEGDIRLEESVAQKIRIRLLWFEGEWRWDPEEGLPYFESLLKKNPDTDYFEALIREKIFEIEEITAIKNVKITFDRKTHSAVIFYVAETDYETITEEVKIQCPTT